MVAVSDTSCVNYLVLIEYIQVLPELYAQVLVPPAVAEELTRPRSPGLVRSWVALAPPWLRVQAPRRPFDSRLDALGSGESQAIALALEVRAGRLLLDDDRARRLAIDLGLPVVGTLGILSEASARKLLDLRDAVARLQATNFYVSAEVIRKLLEPPN